MQILRENFKYWNFKNITTIVNLLFENTFKNVLSEQNLTIFGAQRFCSMRTFGFDSDVPTYPELV